MNNKTNQAGYLVVLRPFRPEERSSSAAEKCEIDSINEGISGMGWEDAFFKGDERMELHDGDNYEKYRNHQRNNKKTGALNKYWDMKPGDYVLTKLLNGNCYIGKVDSEAYHNNEILFENYDHYSWVVDVNWKKRKRIRFHELPSAIQGVMSGRIGTIKRLDELHTHILKRMYEGKRIKKYQLSIDNFHEALSAEDLENLVAYYMKNKHKSFFLVPSTCKKDYPQYEFVMVNPENEKVTCQVKNNKKVEATEYKSNIFKQIYLFSGIGDYGEEKLASNMTIIKRKELFDIIKKQFEDEKGFFYDELSDYYKIA